MRPATSPCALRAKWLWYDPAARKLKLGFDDGLDDAEALTLHVGGVSLGFPDNTGGNSSFTLENVDIAWTDGETVAARVSKPSAAAVSTDATLAVEGATLSPAFDAGVLVYRAAVDAGTVTASANDGGAAVTWGPARGSGELESTLTSVHPYLRFEVSERLSLWGILGYGSGDLTLMVDAAGDTPRKTWKTDTSMGMAATGARGVLLSAADHDGFELAARGDARLVGMSSEAATLAVGDESLAATESETSRVRFVLEGSHGIVLAGGRTLSPTLEVGLRHDGGDAETGIGIELGAGVSYADPALGLTVEGKARGLLAHEDTDYREWGASGSVRIDPGAAGRGLSLTLTPAWGADSGGAERLWSARDARALAANDAFEPAGRFDAEVGYGLGAFGGRGLMRPFAGLSLSDAGNRTWRSGVRWRLGPDVAFGVEGALREAGNDNAAEHGIGFKLTARF